MKQSAATRYLLTMGFVDRERLFGVENLESSRKVLWVRSFLLAWRCGAPSLDFQIQWTIAARERYLGEVSGVPSAAALQDTRGKF